MHNLVDSAVVYLMYELDVEVVQWDKHGEWADYLNTMCKVVADTEPEEYTELDYVDRCAFIDCVCTCLHNCMCAMYIAGYQRPNPTRPSLTARKLILRCIG